MFVHQTTRALQSFILVSMADLNVNDGGMKLFLLLTLPFMLRWLVDMYTWKALVNAHKTHKTNSSHLALVSFSSIAHRKKNLIRYVPLGSLQVVNGCKMKLCDVWLMQRLTESHRKWMWICSHALKMRASRKCNFRSHFLQFEPLLNGRQASCSQVVYGKVGLVNAFLCLVCVWQSSCCACVRTCSLFVFILHIFDRYYHCEFVLPLEMEGGIGGRIKTG